MQINVVKAVGPLILKFEQRFQRRQVISIFTRGLFWLDSSRIWTAANMNKKTIDNSTRNNGMEEGRSGETQALMANMQGVRDYTSSYPQKRDNASDSELNGMDDSRGNSPKFPSSEEDGESGDLFGLNEESSTFEKITHLSRRSLPVIISFFLSLSGSLINLLFAGRFVASGAERSVVFAGVSLGNMFANVTCFSLLIGMSSAIETLGSQHNGAGKRTICYPCLTIGLPYWTSSLVP